MRGIEEVVGDVFMVAVAHGRADPVAEKRQLLLDLVRAVTEDLAAYAQGEGVRLVIDEESMPHVRVDATRLQFVFVKLLSNGIKYADRAKAERWVRVRAQPWGDEQWCVEVQDNGIGIPAEEREAIFDRHVRGSGHEDRPGQGLGLALARDAVEQLGGTIWVDSREGEGSTFRFLVRRPAAKLERDQK